MSPPPQPLPLALEVHTHRTALHGGDLRQGTGERHGAFGRLQRAAIQHREPHRCRDAVEVLRPEGL